MKKSFFLVLIIIAVLFQNCKKDKDDPSIVEQLYEVVDSVRVSLEVSLNKEIPTLNLLIQNSEAGYFISSAAYGEEFIYPETNFRFASNTKNFTATAILNMFEDGWLDYKAKIIDTIPESEIPYISASDPWNIPYKNEITIEQLLQHAAGVYDVDNDTVPGCDGKSYVEYKETIDPNHQFTAEELVEQDMIHNLSYFEPGTGYHYSNTGYSILGEIIARVYSFKSGEAKTYADYLKDYVYGSSTSVPLDFHFPYLAEDNEMSLPFCCSIIYESGEIEINCLDNMSAHVAEGNGYGSIIDLNTYIRSLMKGENVLTPESVELMQNDVSAANDGYSLGCIHVENLGMGHNGAIDGYLSLMVYDPEHDVSVIVMLPTWDLTDGYESFTKCFSAMYDAGWAARSFLGYPGKPK